MNPPRSPSRPPSPDLPSTGSPGRSLLSRTVPGTLYFCVIGFVADCFNFNASAAEIYLADERLHATAEQLGLLGAFSSFGYTAPCLAMGLVSERVGRRPMVLTSLTGLFLLYLAAPYVASMQQLYGVALVRAGLTSLLWPPLMAWMSDISEPAAFSRVLTRYNVSWTSGILLGLGLSGVVYEHLNYRTPFHISAALAALLLLFTLVWRPRRMGAPATVAHPGGVSPGPQNSSGRPVGPGEARLWITRGLVLMGLGCAFQGMILYLTPKIVGEGVGESVQSLLHVTRMGGQACGFFLFALTAGWHFRMWPLLAFVGCSAAGLIVSAVAAPHASAPAGIAMLGLGYGLVGFSFGIAFTMSSYYVLGLFRRKGLGSGIMETIVGGGGLLGPPIAGLIAERSSMQTALFAALVPALLAAVLALPLWGRKKPH